MTAAIFLEHKHYSWEFSFFFFFIPLQKTAEDVNNFDPDFTQEEPTLTPIDDPLIPSNNHNEFENFSFTSPEILHK